MRRQIILTILTFCTVLFLVFSFFNWSRYRSDEAAQSAIISQVSELRRVLAEVPAPEGDPKKELADAQERIDKAKQTLPPAPNSTDIVRRILELGNQNALVIVPLVVDAPGVAEVGRHHYGALNLSVTAKGYYRKVLDFVRALDGIEKAVIIDSVTVTRGTPAEAAAAPYGEIPVTAVLEIVIYSRVQGSAVPQGGPVK
ncbi:MAG: hypothetical protein AB1597_00975 [Chloroflexota bacterium]